MTTGVRHVANPRAGVVEAYRLDRYDNNENIIEKVLHFLLQKLIVWIGMTTNIPACHCDRIKLQKLIVWIGMTTLIGFYSLHACLVVEAYRLDRYDNQKR